MLKQCYPPFSGQDPQQLANDFAAFVANPRGFMADALADFFDARLANWQPLVQTAPAVDPDELHDVPAAAKLLGVVPQTIRDYVKRGILHPHRMRPGGKLYFKRGELVAALNPTTSGHDKRRKANKKA